MKKKALIHVENTDDILEFAEFLSSSGWTILTANKTEDILKKNKIPVEKEPSLVENSLYVNDTAHLIKQILQTQIPENHTFVTAQNEEADENNIFLVCMNAYPFIKRNTNVAQQKQLLKPINYYITSIIRNAFVNYENVLILTDPADYKEAIIQLRTDNISEKFRMYLAAKALNLVSAFDAGIATSILRDNVKDSDFMNYLTFPFQKEIVLHNGANPQQKGCLYKYPANSTYVNNFQKIQGKELTYNILTDVSLAWEQISTLYTNLKTQFSVQSTNCDGYDFTTQFTPLTGTVFTIAVKQNSIVGAALSTSVSDAFNKTYTYDFNHIDDVTLGSSAVIDETAAATMVKANLAAVVAPGFTSEAKEIFTQNKNIRLVPTAKVVCSELDGQLINGGLLLQTKDNVLFEKWNVKTKNRPSQDKTDQMAFGMLLAMGSRSCSAIILKNNSIMGVAQACTSSFSAVNTVLMEVEQNMIRRGIDISACDIPYGDVLIADTPVPFCDSIKTLISKGIKAIIQPGGAAEDEEFINYCNENGVVMVFTGMTHISN